jgi:hypothetical protein
MRKHLTKISRLELRTGEDRIQLMQSMGDIAAFSAQLRVVIVSHFEWLRNLSHGRLGRLAPPVVAGPFDGQDASGADADATALGIDSRVEREDATIERALEEAMAVSYERLQRRWSQCKRKVDMKTAGLIEAIGHLAESYEQRGIFP